MTSSKEDTEVANELREINKLIKEENEQLKTLCETMSRAIL